MLHRVEIENFYSIGETQVMDLRAGPGAAEDDGRLAPLWPGAGEKAPKVVALFGANASGKSNVLKALSFIAWFVKDSFSAPRGSRLPFDRFNDLAMLQAPTRLAVHFSGVQDPSQAGTPDAAFCRYAYELEIGGGTAPRIESEALTYWPAPAGRKIRLFRRDPGGIVAAARAFDLNGFRSVLDKVLRPDASVIATLAQLEHPRSKLIWQSAARVSSNILIYRQDQSDDVAVRLYAQNAALIEALNRDIERIDLGIGAMQIQQGPNGPLAFFMHEGFAHPMPLIYESEGTRQFLRVYPLIVHALQTGGIAIVDELDAAIHPMLLPEILRWFQDSGRNPRNAQLWMSCHSVSLLEELSKDEIWFCEKDNRNRTHVYGLSDVKSVNRTDDFYRKYLGGMFGAVPHIG